MAKRGVSVGHLPHHVRHVHPGSRCAHQRWGHPPDDGDGGRGGGAGHHERGHRQPGRSILLLHRRFILRLWLGPARLHRARSGSETTGGSGSRAGEIAHGPRAAGTRRAWEARGRGEREGDGARLGFHHERATAGGAGWRAWMTAMAVGSCTCTGGLPCLRVGLAWRWQGG